MKFPRVSESISKVPQTYAGKLMMLEKKMLIAEESFDNEDRLYTYEMTEAEYALFELVQTLSSEFIADISTLLNLVHPAIALARNVEEAERIIEDDRDV